MHGMLGIHTPQIKVRKNQVIIPSGQKKEPTGCKMGWGAQGLHI
jgi:hypothetical protein